MARKLNMALVIAMLFVATLLRSSAAQGNRAPSSAPAASPSAATPSPSSSGGGPQTFTVGDAMGWVIPPSMNSYQTWAANKNFRVGDTLVFNFSTGQHDVANVTKNSYDSCNAGSNVVTSGPARITLLTPGEHFFICTVGGQNGHCASGQKLSINVTAAGTPSSVPTPPATTPPPSTTMSPPSIGAAPSSGPSATPPTTQANTAAPLMAVAALPATLLSVAFALLY